MNQAETSADAPAISPSIQKDGGWQTYVDVIYARRWVVLLALFVLLGGAFSFLPKLKFDNTPDAFFLKNDETLAVYESFKSQFASDEYSLIMVRLPDTWTAENMTALRRLTTELGGLPHVRKSTSIVNARYMKDESGDLVVGEFLKAMDATALAKKRAEAMTHPYFSDLYVSKDGRYGSIVVETEIIRGEVDYKIKLATEIRALLAKPEYAGLKAIAVGAPIIDADVRTIVGQESGMFGGMVYVLVTVGFALMFRTWIGALLPAIIAVTAVMLCFSLMAGFGLPVTIVTPIIPSFLISVGVGASVFLMTEVYLAQARHATVKAAVVDAMRHSAMASVLATLTTAGALFAFSPSDIAPVSQVGVVMGVGLIFGLILTLILVPLAFSFTKQTPSSAKTSRLDRRAAWMGAINGWAQRHATQLLALAVALGVVAFVGAMRIKTDYFYLGNFKDSTALRQNYKAVDDVFHGSASIELILSAKGDEPFKNPKVLQAMSTLQQRIEQNKTIPTKTYSLANVVQEISKTLHGNDPAAYVIPADRNTVSQYLLLFESSGYDELHRVTTGSYNVARINVRLPSLPDSAYSELIQQIRADHERLLAGLGVEMQVTGLVPMWIKISQYLAETEAQSLMLSAVVVAVAIMVVMRSVALGVFLTLINAFPILLALGVMGYLGVPLDPYTILIAGIAIGILDDDTIHFSKAVQERLREGASIERALRETAMSSGVAMFGTALVLIMAFSFYAFSSVASLTKFGMLGTLIVVLGIASEVFMTPALIRTLHRAGLFKAEKEA